MPKPVRNPLEEVFPLVVLSIDEWIEQHNPEAIKQDIFERLNKAQKEILLKLLGFDKSWSNEWGLDHCNGRAGNSAAGDYLLKQNEVAIKEWLQQFKPPTVTAAFRERVQKDMQARFQQAILQKARHIAEQAAEDVLNEIKDEILKTDVVEKYFKTEKLLAGD